MTFSVNLRSPLLLPVRTAKLSEESNVIAEVAWFVSFERDCIRLHARTYQEQLYVALAEIRKLKLLR